MLKNGGRPAAGDVAAALMEAAAAAEGGKIGPSATRLALSSCTRCAMDSSQARLCSVMKASASCSSNRTWIQRNCEKHHLHPLLLPLWFQLLHPILCFPPLPLTCSRYPRCSSPRSHTSASRAAATLPAIRASSVHRMRRTSCSDASRLLL